MRVISEHRDLTSYVEGLIFKRDEKYVIQDPEDVLVHYIIFYKRDTENDPSGLKIYDQMITEMNEARDSLKRAIEKVSQK